MRRASAIVLALLIALSPAATAAPKRRAVRVPSPIDESTPQGWLSAHARPLVSTELVPFSVDLEPMRAMVGEADVVGLGEATHGTHQIYSVKLRVVDFLVRHMGFDVVAFEAPFPLLNRMNAYVLGGAGDPEALLAELWTLRYPFWNTEEILALVEWMREYNVHRGDKPPAQIAGMDVLDQITASRDVVAYLQTADPVFAARADVDYECVRQGERHPDCYELAEKIRDDISSREAELIAQSSSAAYHDALQNARVVVQSRIDFGNARDENLAQNALWIREHRGSTRKMIVWAHNEHVSEVTSEWLPIPMGIHLTAVLGEEYFSIATLAGSGSFLQWTSTVTTHVPTTNTWPPVQEGSYESYLRQSGHPNFFVSLQGSLPSWLTTAARYNAGTTNTGGRTSVTGSLPAKFDAAIYMEVTTPSHPLPH